MPDSTSTARIVLSTTSSIEEAQRIARSLVEEHLIACASIIPRAQSIYRWQGEIEIAEEALLLLKTAQDQLVSLEARLHALHSYETPEFLVLSVDSGSQTYLEWIQSSLLRP